MAFAQNRGGKFRVVFHFGGKKYRKSLKTDKASVADAVVGGVKRTLMMLEQGILQIPDGADVLAFVLSGGKETKTAAVKQEEYESEFTLEQLRDKYVETMSIGAIEKVSLDTIKMHIKHMIQTLGSGFRLKDLGLRHLQDHVNRRAKAKGRRGAPLSAYTIRKEISSLRAAWNWGMQSGFIDHPYPNKGLKFPKLDEKMPFQTWAEIERRIELGRVVNGQALMLWDCLYLQKGEIEELLAYVKEKATMPWLYPLVCTAAHTGARRSELVRIEIADVDFDGDTILIREKKRAREKRTTRRVTITPFLKEVLRDWLKIHPGGGYLFMQAPHVFRSKKRSKTTGHLSQKVRPTTLKERMETVKERETPMAEPLTRNEAHDHFKRTLADGKWKVIRGFHMLRHSFISCLAAGGIDQRIIDDLVGHQTEQQRQRYRHLTPNLKKEAVNRVFAA